ncbi:MAG: glycosyltransferase family 2 protein [Micrococcales bacterium]|nr:glycosyltransferase family 2 protein [Micrococcales bacterium]
MTANPRVTMAVPVYNGEKYLAEALTALVTQDFDDMEILISDNASTDATPEIAADFAARDQRITLVRQEKNIGGGHNSNVLMDQAKGEMFKWAYHDDVCGPGLVSALVKALDDDREAVGAFPWVRRLDEDSVDRGPYEDHLYVDLDGPAHERVALVLKGMLWPTQFGLFRTEVVRAAGGTCVSTSGEYVLPAALAVRGRLRLVSDAVQHIREHTERAGGERVSEAVWVDPNRPHVVFPYARKIPLVYQAVRDGAREVGLDAAERRACLRAVHRTWTLPGLRAVAGDVVRLPVDLGWVKSG